jgi:hypothetical protein
MREHIGRDAAHAWSLRAATILCWVTAVVVLAACTSTTPEPRSGRVVTSQHNGWSIRVAPSLTDRWRARVRVWPPDVSPQTHGGINLHFTGTAATESAIVQSATAAARRYIEASRRANE